MTSLPTDDARELTLRAELAALTPKLARLADEHWRRDAACAEVGPDAFFPKMGDVRHAHAASRRICTGCSVRPECFASAWAADERFGTWGGVTAGEREKLRKKRLAAEEAARERRQVVQATAARLDGQAALTEAAVNRGVDSCGEHE
ncbi:WhiB family transcriptional regulator [Amycolatopsis kentuckyensis]|uniref:WhiB family transcriptional regulator n=1 Tax=Amycolatopsis kentuckyensis TaxID=218823 RepID=UPI0035674072